MNAELLNRHRTLNKLKQIEMFTLLCEVALSRLNKEGLCCSSFFNYNFVMLTRFQLSFYFSNYM